MLLKLETIKENVLNMSRGVSGTLKFGVSKSMMKYKLPTLLRLFQEKYPDVKFNVITDWSSDIFNAVYNKNVHISFVRGDYSWSNKKHLLLEEYICIASKDKIDVENLPSLPRIDYKTDRLLRRTWMFYHEESLKINVVKAFVDFVKKYD